MYFYICLKSLNVLKRNPSVYLILFFHIQMFVLAVTMCREAFDDFIRFLRDKEVNSQVYKKLTKKGK